MKLSADLRKTWLDLKGSYWFIPTILSIAAIGLSTFTIWLDLRGAGWWFSGTGWLESSGVEGARSLLTVIASAMISMASTVFAITIAAVAYASGNYGPRLLTNFMNDRGNQVSLGVFIATFIYAVLVLRVVDSGDNPAGTEGTDVFIPQLSLFVTTLIAGVAIAVLVYFLHHIPASIRINSVIAGIGRKLMTDIDTRFPDEANGRTLPPALDGWPLCGPSAGYVEIIDFEALGRCAEECDGVVSLCVRTGDFVHPGLAMARISGLEQSDELIDRLCDCFAIGSSRTRAQDIEYLMDELVEIALRALSPGVNDPFTAVSSIHWLGAALARLAGRDLARGPEQERYDPERVRPLDDDFQHFLNRSFGAVRPSVAGSTMAAGTFLEMLAGVDEGAATADRREAVAEQARRLGAQAAKLLEGPAFEDVRERLRGFEDRTGARGAERTFLKESQE